MMKAVGNEKIDFFMSWVDGSDLEWQAEKLKWEGLESNKSVDGNANADCRYRDNGWLKYWFRGVEKFAPWVNKIHFVTCGQKPDWLVEVHPKLNLVNHKDYIPSQYLPTFCSRTIEFNCHRIKEMSEQFVMFNDDMFLLQPVSPGFYFNNGNPVLSCNLRYPDNLECNNSGRVLCNDYFIVNSAFNIGNSIWTHRNKWFNVREIGFKRALRNIVCFFANRTLPVGNYGHFPLPHLKSTIEEVWDTCSTLMDNTCRHKFRADDQLSQYLFCAWNQAKGRFYPTSVGRKGCCVTVDENSLSWMGEMIRKQAVPQICLNELGSHNYFEFCVNAVVDAFETILPDKSSFEKY